MVDGLISKQEKPSNTEVLGEIISEEKINFIGNLTHENIEGLAGIKFWTNILFENQDPGELMNQIIKDIQIMKCSVKDKKGNRADQIVDALKHIIEDENKDNAQSLVDSIRKN